MRNLHKGAIATCAIALCGGVARGQTVAPAAPATVQPIPVVIVEQPLPSRKNRVSFGPLSMALGIGNFTYERGLGKHFSAEVSPLFVYWGWGDTKIYGGGAGVGGSVYFVGDAPRGLRLKVDVMPVYVRGESGSKGDGVFAFGARALFGYNWIWRSGFTLGLAGGFQYLHFSIDGVSSALNGILPAADFNLGFAW